MRERSQYPCIHDMEVVKQIAGASHEVEGIATAGCPVTKGDVPVVPAFGNWFLGLGDEFMFAVEYVEAMTSLCLCL